MKRIEIMKTRVKLRALEERGTVTVVSGTIGFKATSDGEVTAFNPHPIDDHGWCSTCKKFAWEY